MKCWGYNLSGELGNGTGVGSSTPVTVSGINNAVKITTGNQYTCALLSDNTVKCWGFNQYNTFGSGGELFITPKPVLNLP